MRRLVDLHTHSNASDGALAPERIVRLADARRLAAVALTDHDTLAGLPAAADAARGFPELRLVLGVEISAKSPDGTLHILGLGIEPHRGALAETLETLLAARNRRNPKMIARLRDMGVEITMDELTAFARGDRPADAPLVVGRLHMADLLRRKGHARSLPDAFARYVGDTAPAFVDKERLPPAEAIAAIHGAGGLAVLAHPAQLRCRNYAQVERIVRGLIRHGIDAIEVYHPDHTPEQTRAYLDLAKALGLGITGGSDFHGGRRGDTALGRPRVPLSVLGEKLTDALLS